MIVIEEWKDIEGFGGLYQVSNLGRVRSIRKILTPKDNGHGYKSVCLCLGLNRYYRYIHRLVAEAFIPNPKRFKEVDHIDCSRDNNSVTNLRWTSHKLNCNDITRANRISKGNVEIIIEGKSLRDLSKELCIPYCTLWRRIKAGWSNEDIIKTPKRKWSRK